MGYFSWDAIKNEKLTRERGISFEEVVLAIEKGNILDVISHPNASKYRHQRMYIVELNGYAYLVPFIEDKEFIFLKTIIPSRKATKKYLEGGKDETI